MNRLKRITVFILLSGFLLTTAVARTKDVRRVRFQRGRSTAVVRGTVKRDRQITYLVNARAGQHMSLSITRGAAFRLSTPSGNSLEGGKGVSRTEQDLEETGDYRVVVENWNKKPSTPFKFEVVIL